MLSLFGSNATINIALDRKDHNESTHGKRLMFQGNPLFTGDEPVRGTVTIIVPTGKTLSYSAIKIELLGTIYLGGLKNRPFHFLSLVNELSSSGELADTKTFDFEFLNFIKEYETYIGTNIQLKYYLKVTIVRSMKLDISKELELVVHVFSRPETVNTSIKMEVGIEGRIHIEFEYDKSRYHFTDVIVGKIFFLVVNVPIKHMELQLLRKEIIGQGEETWSEVEMLNKYEIMDGVPVKGESIPVRMFLSAFPLTPTYRAVHSKFSVRYYLNLILVDHTDRRYFKSEEVVLYRRVPKRSKADRKLNDPVSPTIEAPSKAPE